MIMITVISIYVAIYMASRFTTNNPKANPAIKTNNPLPHAIFTNKQPQDQNKNIIYQRQEIKNPQNQKSNNKKSSAETRDEKNKLQPNPSEDHIKGSSNLKESKLNNTSAKYGEWDNHTGECIKHLISSLEASTSGDPKDIKVHIISTVSSTYPEPAIQLNKCGSCNVLPLHAFKGNSQLDL